MRDRGITPGRMNDPVAQSIRNEQNRDAMPSKSEQKRMHERQKVLHAQYKACEAFLNHYDQSTSKFHFMCASKIMNFDDLYNHAKSGVHDFSSFQTAREEPHERNPERERRMRKGKPMEVTEEVRQLKNETFRVVQQAIDEVESINSNQKILNPFGGQKAYVVAVNFKRGTHRGNISETRVFTNGTFERAMDRSQWNQDRFEDDGPHAGDYHDTIEKYQNALEKMHLHTTRGND